MDGKLGIGWSFVNEGHGGGRVAPAHRSSRRGDYALVSPEAPDAPDPEKSVTRLTERFFSN